MQSRIAARRCAVRKGLPGTTPKARNGRSDPGNLQLMSRLDSFIRRLVAQRDILNFVASDLDLPGEGVVLELGLGNGRTYSHLREVFPKRRIVAFDRTLAAHASSRPPAADLVLGEIRETASVCAECAAALVHADIGTGYSDVDAATLMWLPALVASLLVAGGVAISGLPLEDKRLLALSLPFGIAADRYFLYRRTP